MSSVHNRVTIEFSEDILEYIDSNIKRLDISKKEFTNIVFDSFKERYGNKFEIIKKTSVRPKT